jgi:Tol biopolymer transport system component
VNPWASVLHIILPTVNFLFIVPKKGGSVDLWLYHFADNTSHKITSTEGEEFCPHWAPDGQRIAFILEGRMCLLTTASNTLDHLSNISLPVHSLCWAADKNEIIFSAGDADETALYRYDLDKKRAAPLGTKSTFGTNPDFSILKNLFPYSEYQVAFQRDENIYVYSCSDDLSTRIADSGEVPAWSPDGTQLVYSIQGSIVISLVWNFVHEK